MHGEDETSPSLLLAVRSLSNQESWRRFVAIYEPLISRWLRSRGCVPDKIPDVISDIYLKLLNHLPSFIYDPQKSFRGWLKCVAENAFLDSQKRASNRNEKNLEGTVLDRLVDQDSYQSYEQRLLDDFIEKLDERVAKSQDIVTRVKKRVAEKTWSAFVLTEIDGLTCAEAATILNMGESSVYVARFRIRNQLHREASLQSDSNQ